MPVKNGYDATREIRQKNKNVPILAVTAYVLEIDKEKILSSGFNDHLTKPVTIARLLKILKQYLNNSG